MVLILNATSVQKAFQKFVLLILSNYIIDIEAMIEKSSRDMKVRKIVKVFCKLEVIMMID